MEFFEKIVEEKIQKAQKLGEFDGLAGQGKPLASDDDRGVPEDFRLVFKILKNADCLPPEIELRRDIVRLRDLISSVDDSDGDRRATLIRDVNIKILSLNLIRSTSLKAEAAKLYVGKKLGSRSTSAE